MAKHSDRSSLGYFVAYVIGIDTLIVLATFVQAFMLEQPPSTGAYTFMGIVFGTETIVSAWIKTKQIKAGTNG